MKPIISALILSIIIHLLIFIPIKFEKDEVEKKPKKKIEKKASIRYVKLKPKKITLPYTPEEVVKKTDKPKEYKIVKKEKIKPQKKNTKKKKAKKIPSKTKKKNIKSTKPKKKIIVTKRKKSKSVLENFLSSDPKPVNTNLLDKETQSYIKLYGKEFEKLSDTQKVFIQNKIKNIASITRRYYRFPEIAKELRKGDFNIVEFSLHPNGDISGLKIVQEGEYSFYDKSIIEAIEFAYKDYPLPKVTTKIKLSINYIVY